MTSRIKQLILERQRAFHSDKSGRWRELRTRVRDEIAARKKAFYPEKVSFLKNTDPRKWWSLVNKLSSKSCGASAISYEVDRYYLTLPAFLPAPDELPAHGSLQKTTQAKSFQSLWSWRDSNRILKLFASELSEPVTTIFNRSLSSGDFSSAWRDAYISPIPNASPVPCDNDLRPVALTACLSKVFEDFVV